MKVILQYFMSSLLVIVLISIVLVSAVMSFPIFSFAIASLATIVLYIFKKRKETNDRNRGWRVGHQGRDQMYYEEFLENKWKRIQIDGGMLTGKAHHEVYLSSIKYPDWAQERKKEIILRIKSEFKGPEYEY